MFSFLRLPKIVRTAACQRPGSVKPRLEALEDRCLPSVSITDFGIPTSASSPNAVTAGPDGNVWFVEADANQIGRITPTGSVTGEFSIPTPGSRPAGITAGPDGNLWFAEFNGNKIGRMTTTGVVTGEFSVPTPNSQVFNIVSGPDGNLWFTELHFPRLSVFPTARVGD